MALSGVCLGNSLSIDFKFIRKAFARCNPCIHHQHGYGHQSYSARYRSNKTALWRNLHKVHIAYDAKAGLARFVGNAVDPYVNDHGAFFDPVCFDELGDADSRDYNIGATDLGLEIVRARMSYRNRAIEALMRKQNRRSSSIMP